MVSLRTLMKISDSNRLLKVEFKTNTHLSGSYLGDFEIIVSHDVREWAQVKRIRSNSGVIHGIA